MCSKREWNKNTSDEEDGRSEIIDLSQENNEIRSFDDDDVISVYGESGLSCHICR